MTNKEKAIAEAAIRQAEAEEQARIEYLNRLLETWKS